MLDVHEYRNPDNPKNVSWEVWNKDDVLLVTSDILEVSQYLIGSDEDFTLTKKVKMEWNV